MVSLKEILSSKNVSLPKYKVITYIDGFNLYFGIRFEAIKRGFRHEFTAVSESTKPGLVRMRAHRPFFY